MKCQNCGQSEVNFYYTSNINGAVTEKHLCSKCAHGAGYDIMNFMNYGNIFREIQPMIGMLGNHHSANRKKYICTPTFGKTCDCGSTCEIPGEAKPDNEMAERRELNMQLRMAIENEEFEKAAQLRDRIKELGQ